MQPELSWKVYGCSAVQRHHNCLGTQKLMPYLQKPYYLTFWATVGPLLNCNNFVLSYTASYVHQLISFNTRKSHLHSLQSSLFTSHKGEESYFCHLIFMRRWQYRENHFVCFTYNPFPHLLGHGELSHFSFNSNWWQIADYLPVV